MSSPTGQPILLTPFHGRLLVVTAAVLWSLSGAFTKLLTRDTVFALNEPPLHGLIIAFYRVLFAGLVLTPTLRLRDFTYRPFMLAMVAVFAAMNALFVMAMNLGTAANAIWLQYTAPMWLYLAGVWWLGEKTDRRSTTSLIVSLLGVAVIVLGGYQDAQLGTIAIALGSGLAYAGVILCLRLLRAESARWLTVLNHLGGALAILPVLIVLQPRQPGPGQLVVLFIFGAIQMGLPYWIMARALKSVTAQEAGMITLLEPLLNPIWAYLVAPESEVPSIYTLLGGVLILGALIWRYVGRSPAN